MNADSNPYASPSETAPSRYEWPLWRRILYACSVIAIVYILCGTFALWQAFRHISSVEHATPIEQVKAFLGGWDSLQKNSR